MFYVEKHSALINLLRRRIKNCVLIGILFRRETLCVDKSFKKAN